MLINWFVILAMLSRCISPNGDDRYVGLFDDWHIRPFDGWHVSPFD